ncbi:MAG: hypothetical protein U1F83_02465 [Verrucomicrobiota bacterium]
MQLRWCIVGDELYGGKPLWLSKLKRDYRPLSPVARNASLLARGWPYTRNNHIAAPHHRRATQFHASWSKDLRVAVKYLRNSACSIARERRSPLPPQRGLPAPTNRKLRPS